MATKTKSDTIKYMKNFVNEFKSFVAKGNVIDLAVGLAIGASFQKIVTSLVNDIIFPALAPLLNVAQFSDWQINGVLIGNFIKNVVDFLIVALAIFFVIKVLARFRKKEEQKPAEPTKEEKLLTEIRDILKNK
jgi:large conductance mechanosensitive channel